MCHGAPPCIHHILSKSPTLSAQLEAFVGENEVVILETVEESAFHDIVAAEELVPGEQICLWEKEDGRQIENLMWGTGPIANPDNLSRTTPADLDMWKKEQDIEALKAYDERGGKYPSNWSDLGPRYNQ